MRALRADLFSTIARVAAATAGAIGVFALLGWVADLYWFERIVPDWVSLKVNAAVGLMACSLALWVSVSERYRRWAGVLGVAIIALGGLTLGEHLFRWDFHVDQMLLHQPLGPHDSAPGRMAPATAMSFVLLGFAFVLGEARIGRRLRPASHLATAVIAIAGAVLIGYFYEARALFAFVPFDSMAIHSATGLLLLAVGFHAAHPQEVARSLVNREDLGGMALRSLLPAALILPVAVGWLVLQGNRAAWYATPIALALASVGMSATLLALLFPVARALGRVGTKRKHALEALSASEARLRSMFTLTGVAVAEINLEDGAYLRVNPRLCELLGYSEAELLRMNVFDVTHQDDRAPQKRAFAEMRAGTRNDYETEKRFNTKDGAPLWGHVSNRALRDRDGGATTCVGMMFDVTERVRAEAALRESEERFRHLADAMPQVVWTARPDGALDYFNQRARELSGLVQSAEGTWHWQPVVHPDDLAATVAAWEAAVRGGKAYQIEHRARTADGTWRWYLSRAVPYRDELGNIVRWVGTGTDVQPLKETEQELRHTEARLRDLTAALEQRVEERTGDLTQLQRRLRALVADMTLTERRERQRLAKELHDYLGQLLAAAKLRVDAAIGNARDKPGSLPLRAATDALDEAIAYTRSLVTELSPVVLYDLGLLPALRWLAEQMARHGLRVDLEAGVPEPSLSQDEAIITFECVRELLWNVLKHADVARASVSVSADAGWFAITVVDSGRGFDPCRLQEPAAGSEHFGLFSVRERLRAHSGELEVVSSKGDGTRATIRLPLRAAEQALPPPAPGVAVQ